MLRVCNNGGTWVIEGVAACSANGANLNSGPGGANFAEYYNWDFFTENATWDPTNTQNATYHKETFSGGLLQLSNSTAIMSTAIDPYDDFSGGVVLSENTTGRRRTVPAPPGTDAILETAMGGGYTIYDSGQYSGGPPTESTFGKANGLGDLEAMCEPAPLQIGNYVWEDTDADGEQDPDENPIGGVKDGII